MPRESESVPEELPRRYVAICLHDGKKCRSLGLEVVSRVDPGGGMAHEGCVSLEIQVFPLQEDPALPQARCGREYVKA